MTITNSTVKGNTTAGNGGGIYNTGTANIFDTSLIGNTGLKGGGLANIVNPGSAVLINSTVQSNTATFGVGGRGVYTTGSGTLILEATTISDNTPNQITS